MKSVLFALLTILNSQAFAAEEFSAFCNCKGVRGRNSYYKATSVAGSGYSVGGAIKNATSDCFSGAYPGTCKVFNAEGKLIWEDKEKDTSWFW